jgi:hypothetical protein
LTRNGGVWELPCVTVKVRSSQLPERCSVLDAPETGTVSRGVRSDSPNSTGLRYTDMKIDSF